jgi:hypothetical protein
MLNRERFSTHYTTSEMNQEVRITDIASDDSLQTNKRRNKLNCQKQKVTKEKDESGNYFSLTSKGGFYVSLYAL